MNSATDDLKVGKLYRLRFPGIAARVIEPPAGMKPPSSEYCYLVESLFLRMRWWVNRRGEPDNIYSPNLVVPASKNASGNGGGGSVAVLVKDEIQRLPPVTFSIGTF